jgi:hypothetical protein
LLAQVARRLVADHPGLLFVQYGSGVDRICRIGVVPARHSRTKWLLAFGAAIASTPAFRLDDSVRSLSFACRFRTVPQNRAGCEAPVLLSDCPSFTCAAPAFLQPAPAPSVAPPSPPDVEAASDEGDGELDELPLDDLPLDDEDTGSGSDF